MYAVNAGIATIVERKSNMKIVTYQIECCVDCPFFEDNSSNDNFESTCISLNKEFNFPEEGSTFTWFPDFCPLEDAE